MIGLVGKPSSGKSTFFNAACERNEKTAPYPFTTLEPSEGVAYVRVRCPETEFGVKCNPRYGFCVEGNRFIPVKMVDVPGLVPGAHKGRGLGNRFLDALRREKVLIHVIDLSGATDSEGNPVPPGTHDPEEDIRFLEEEIRAWVRGIVERGWEKAKKYPKEERKRVLVEQLSGIGYIPESEDPEEIVEEIMEKRFPIVLAGNKADTETGRENYERLRKRYDIVPVSAEAELVLRRAAAMGLIRYLPGDPDFEVTGSLTPEQERALELVREKVLKRYGGTGVQKVINKAVFDVLGYKVVYPVENENKLSDSKGNILPDAFLLPRDATLLDLAYEIHTDIGKKCMYGVDVRSGRRIGKEEVLENGAVVKIVHA